jgi:hypothetical protein
MLPFLKTPHFLEPLLPDCLICGSRTDIANLRPCTGHSHAYKCSPALPLLDLFFFFFFILTLIECREIKNTLHYGGEPALHIVVLAAMNCPSGPFRSEFLLSQPSFSL